MCWKISVLQMETVLFQSTSSEGGHAVKTMSLITIILCLFEKHISSVKTKLQPLLLACMLVVDMISDVFLKQKDTFGK